MAIEIISVDRDVSRELQRSLDRDELAATTPLIQPAEASSGETALDEGELQPAPVESPGLDRFRLEREREAALFRSRDEFEGQRREAGARLALAVERVELDQPGVVLEQFRRTQPVIILGSLKLDVVV